MPNAERAWRAAPGLLFWLCAAIASGQTQVVHAPVTVSVVDENGVAVSGAQVTVTEPGQQPAHLRTDFAGVCSFALRQQSPYQLHVEKPGFYATDANGIGTGQTVVKVVLAHEQIVHEQVSVTASPTGIDTQEIPNQTTMNTPEIVKFPFKLRATFAICCRSSRRGAGYDGTGARGRLGELGNVVHNRRLRCALAGRGHAGHESEHGCGAVDRFRDHALPGGVRPRYRRRAGLLDRDGRQQVSLQRDEFHTLLPRTERNPLRQICAAVHVLRAAPARPGMVV